MKEDCNIDEYKTVLLQAKLNRKAEAYQWRTRVKTEAAVLNIDYAAWSLTGYVEISAVESTTWTILSVHHGFRP